MRKVLSTTVIAVALFAGPTAASAQGGNRSVPAGDSLAQTPPPDVTRQELQAAPPTDKTPKKIQQLQQEPGVSSSVVPPKP